MAFQTPCVFCLLTQPVYKGLLTWQMINEPLPNFQYQSGTFICKFKANSAHQNLHNQRLWKFIYDGTQETYWGWWLCGASYIWGYFLGKIILTMRCTISENTSFLKLSPLNSAKLIVIVDMLFKETSESKALVLYRKGFFMRSYVKTFIFPRR